MHTHTADPEAIGSYGPLSDAEGKRTFKLTVLRVTKRGVVCRIAGVDGSHPGRSAARH